MADIEKFEPGEIVMIISGGPEMAVTWVNDESAGCMWWNAATSTYLLESFPLPVLTHV